jgi:predicted O-methyltransferase YrrM
VPGFFQLKTYFNYWLDAVNEHSLHSPFLFDLYTKVLKSETFGIPEIEKLRIQLVNNNREIEVEDFGKGSKHIKGSVRKISDIAKTSMNDARFSSLFLRLIHHIKAKTVVELGTSFGINTLYLAQSIYSKIYTFEGANAIADIADLTFDFGDVKNVELIRGNIDSTLYSTLSRIPKVDFALLDANHRYEPTLKYFEWILNKIHHDSIIVMDDIHDSPEMERAWAKIKKHDLVYTSVDLYRCGIVFFDPSLTKQHVVLQF